MGSSFVDNPFLTAMDEIVECSRCHLPKPVSEFHRHADGHYRWCKSCKSTYFKTYSKTERGRKSIKEAAWKMAGIKDFTVENYQDMAERQNGKCAICRRPTKKLQADHNHSTGKVRGLLCQACNLVIGQAHDSIDILEKSVLYLRYGYQDQSEDPHSPP